MATSLSVTVKGKTAKIRMDHRTALRQATAIVVDNIVSRTLGGRDVRGRFFTGYASSIKGKRKPGGGGTYSGRVNLKDSGQMLGSLKGKVTARNKAVVAFTNSDAVTKATFHQKGTRKKTGKLTRKGRAATRRGMPKREFVGVSKATRKRIRDVLGVSVGKWRF